MEQIKSAADILNLIRQPAFCVQDQIITHVNPAAEPFLIELGTPISALLVNGNEEYLAFTSGNLYLMVTVAGAHHGAIVSRMNGFDIFLLEEASESAQLHTLSFAAQTLREPLASIMNATEQLVLPPFEEDSPNKEQFSQIHRGLNQLLRLVSNMSDAFRYVQYKCAAMETCNISVFLQEIFSAAKAQIEQTGRTLEFRGLSQTLFCLINAEPLERAVYNLLSNAVKFSPVGSRILASLVRRKQTLYLTIENTDDGTSNKPQSNWFSDFLREPGIIDGRFGLGLGMVLVRAAALAHGGTVLIQQPPGSTRITISLPIRQNTDGMLHNNVLQVDYLGEMDHGLIELSDVLPPSAFLHPKV